MTPDPSAAFRLDARHGRELHVTGHIPAVHGGWTSV
jgi:hypothetical protein